MRQSSTHGKEATPRGSYIPAHGRRKKSRPANPRLSITSLDVALRFIQENAEKLPSDLYEGLIRAIPARDISSIRELSASHGSPQLYREPRHVATIAQAFALLTKVEYPFGGGDQSRKERALRKFYASEQRCRRVNRRFKWFHLHPDRESQLMADILARAKSKLFVLLGDVFDSLPGILTHGRFGPGATRCTEDVTETGPWFKMQHTAPTVTRRAKPYIEEAMRQDQYWYLSCGKVDWATQTVRVEWQDIESCRLTFVPKDEETYRTIAIEPYGNVWLQLGVDYHIRRRLRVHAGIDLDDQRPNQRFARWASENWLSSNTMSTIDLSSASDCVSVGLVERLLPSSWVALLSDLRCEKYFYEGKEHVMHKWSSMGNGFTFALETAIFWSVVQSCEDLCGEERALVYGDDILVSRPASLLAIEALRYCGFSVNPDKSFVVGPFRESCGADFYMGSNVRPTFVKSYNLTVCDAYKFLNRIALQSLTQHSETWHFVLKHIPRDRLFHGPPSEMWDSYLHVERRELRGKLSPGLRWNRDHQCYYHKLIRFVADQRTVDDYAALGLVLRSKKEEPWWDSDSRWLNRLVTVGYRQVLDGTKQSYRIRGKFRIGNAVV